MREAKTPRERKKQRRQGEREKRWEGGSEREGVKDM
jgi:hypothetical protein